MRSSMAIAIAIFMSFSGGFAYSAEEVLITNFPPSIRCTYASENLNMVENAATLEAELNHSPPLAIDEVNAIFDSFIVANFGNSPALITSYQIFPAKAQIQGLINLDWVYLLDFIVFENNTPRVPAHEESRNIMITKNGTILEVNCNAR